MKYINLTLIFLLSVLFSGCIMKIDIEQDPEYTEYHKYKKQQMNKKYMVLPPTVYIDNTNRNRPEEQYLNQYDREIIIK